MNTAKKTHCCGQLDNQHVDKKERTHNSATLLLWVFCNRWTGPEQFEDPSGQLMMLHADLALVWDKGEKSGPLTMITAVFVYCMFLCIYDR